MKKYSQEDNFTQYDKIRVRTSFSRLIPGNTAVDTCAVVTGIKSKQENLMKAEVLLWPTINIMRP